jgi:cytoskeletal protein CcmA (bactofilin family)
MFKRKPSKDIQIDTLIGAKTRIHGDVEFAGGCISTVTSTAM